MPNPQNHHVDDCVTTVPLCLTVSTKVHQGPCPPPDPRPCGCGDWIQASSSVTQPIEEANTAQIVQIETVDATSGTIVPVPTGFTAPVDGSYLVVASPQVGRGDGPPAAFYCWLMVDGVDVANTSVLMNTQSGPMGGTKDVIVSQGVIELQQGQVISVAMATTDPRAGVMAEAIQPPVGPLVPAIIFTMVRV